MWQLQMLQRETLFLMAPPKIKVCETGFWLGYEGDVWPGVTAGVRPDGGRSARVISGAEKKSI